MKTHATCVWTLDGIEQVKKKFPDVESFTLGLGPTCRSA
jgi:hypothetical protein